MEKDHLEILLEDIRGKFDLVLEGHSSLHAEMQSMRQDLGEKIEHVDFKVGILNQKIDGVEASLSARIDGIEASLSARIDGVEASLSARIDGVEASLSEKIDAVAADLSAHRADTEAHHGVYRVKE
jgi:chromosome segregation ATPase